MNNNGGTAGKRAEGRGTRPLDNKNHLKHLQVSYFPGTLNSSGTHVCVRADKHTHTHTHAHTHTWKHMPDCTQTHTHSGADTGKRTRMKKKDANCNMLKRRFVARSGQQAVAPGHRGGAPWVFRTCGLGVGEGPPQAPTLAPPPLPGGTNGNGTGRSGP